MGTRGGLPPGALCLRDPRLDALQEGLRWTHVAEEETEAERMEVAGQGHPDVRGGHRILVTHTPAHVPLLTTEGTLPSPHPT